MGISTKVSHKVAKALTSVYHRQFVRASHSVEDTQRRILKNILVQAKGAQAHRGAGISASTSWEEFRSELPITDYDYWREWIDNSNGYNNLTSSPIERYQPTSGSTSAIKWIPYSKAFLSEINNGLMAWIGDMYRQYPSIEQGHHYWSVSWIPTALRSEVDENINDDLKMLPWWKRAVAARYMAVPESVASAETSDDTLFASVAWLVARRDLSFLSIWSPTFALSLIEFISVNKLELVKVLRTGDWHDRKNALYQTACPRSLDSATIIEQATDVFDPEFLHVLWPKLKLISCWDTASNKIWANKLRQLFPHAKIQGKGLWATEAAVTIPFENKFPLAVTSHFYEFQDLDSGLLLPSWQLEEGMEVSPVVTTGAGFLRYKINDKLSVTGFYNDTPCFEFLGRLDGTDLAGEKISVEFAQQIIELFGSTYSVRPVALLAIPGDILDNGGAASKGGYMLLCEPKDDQSANDVNLNSILEQQLLEHFHYRLARELKQLVIAKVLVSINAMDIYHHRCKAKGMALGNIKIEPLVLWDTDISPTSVQV